AAGVATVVLRTRRCVQDRLRSVGQARFSRAHIRSELSDARIGHVPRTVVFPPEIRTSEVDRTMVSEIRSVAVALGVVVLAVTAVAQHAMATRDFFYVGGSYAGAKSTEVMAGQMYVEVLRPQRVTKRYPIVFFHGAGQTATNWLGTPDGRPGWADYFLNSGYVVYLVDQPARGRSAWRPSINGPLQTVSVG